MTLYSSNKKVIATYNYNRLVDMYRYGEIVNLDDINPVWNDKILHVERGVGVDTASKRVIVPTTDIDLTPYWEEATKTEITEVASDSNTFPRTDTSGDYPATGGTINLPRTINITNLPGPATMELKATASNWYWARRDYSLGGIGTTDRFGGSGGYTGLFNFVYTLLNSTGTAVVVRETIDDIISNLSFGSLIGTLSVTRTVDIPSGQCLGQVGFNTGTITSNGDVFFAYRATNARLSLTINKYKYVGSEQSGKMFIKVNRDERNNTLGSDPIILSSTDTTNPSSNALTSYISLGTFSIDEEGQIYQNITKLKYLQFNPTQNWTADFKTHGKIGFSIHWVLPAWSMNKQIVGVDASDNGIAYWFGTTNYNNKPAIRVGAYITTFTGLTENIFQNESTVTFDGTDGTMKINDYSSSTGHIVNIESNVNWVYLRANIGVIRIYEYKVFDTSGNLMKHFIPVIKNNQPGFLDKLDASFHTFGMSSVTYEL